LKGACSQTNSIAAPYRAAFESVSYGCNSDGNHFALCQIDLVVPGWVDFRRKSIPRKQRKAPQGRPDSFRAPRTIRVTYRESFDEARGNARRTLVRFDGLVHTTLHNQ
jgi:hypothetical protein